MRRSLFTRNSFIRPLMTGALLAAFALTGCGVTGSLKTPPPLFGDKTKVPPVDVPEEVTSEETDLLDLLDDLND